MMIYYLSTLFLFFSNFASFAIAGKSSSSSSEEDREKTVLCDYGPIDNGSPSQILSVGQTGGLGWRLNQEIIMTPRNWIYRSDNRVELAGQRSSGRAPKCLTVTPGKVRAEPCNCSNEKQVLFFLNVPRVVPIADYVIYSPRFDIIVSTTGNDDRPLTTVDARVLEQDAIPFDYLWFVPTANFFKL